MIRSNNDNSSFSRGLNNSDAPGYAALALTESLLHSLVDNSIINLAEADNIVSIAIDATQAAVDDLPTRTAFLKQSIFLLANIKRSLNFV